MRNAFIPRRTVRSAGLVIALLLAISSPAWRQSAAHGASGTDPTPGARSFLTALPKAPAPRALGDNGVVRSRQVSWDLGLLESILCFPATGSPQSLPVQLFPDVSVTLVGGVVNEADDTVNWSADLDGDPDGHADLVATGMCEQPNTLPAAFTIDIQTGSGLRTYTVRSSTPTLADVEEIDSGSGLGDGASSADDEVLPPGAPRAKAPATRPTVPKAAGGAAPQGAPGPSYDPDRSTRAAPANCTGATDVTTVDLALFYTQSVVNRVGADAVLPRVEAAVADASQAMIDTGLPFRIRLVHVGPAEAEQNFPGDNTGLDSYRRWITQNNLDAKYAADEVGVIDTEPTAQGYLLEIPGLYPGYSVFQGNLAYLARYVVSHEMGHNFGLRHDWIQDPALGLYPYSHGWIARSGKWRTVMVYDVSCNFCTLINRYSDANATFQGEPLGAPAGTLLPSDQVRVLRSNVPVVASFQPSRVPPVYCRLTVSPDNASHGSARALQPGPYLPNSLVYASATPAPGFRLDHWELNGQVLPGKATTPYPVSVTQDGALVAVFTPISCTVSTVASPAAGGTVVATPSGAVACGGTVSATATPNPGWHFVDWLVNGRPPPLTRAAPVTNTFTISSDTVITAEFAPDTPALSLTKSVFPATATAGQTVTYQYRVTNSGTVTVTGLQVNETTFTGAGSAPVPNCLGTTTLAPGAQVTCVAGYTVRDADVVNGTVANTATATATVPGGATVASAPSTALVSVTGTPGISLVKRALSTTAALGDTVTYLFQVTNTGTVPLTGVRVAETAFSGTGPAPVPDCLGLTRLDAGAQATCVASYVVTQADVTAGYVANTATASGTPPGGPAVTSSPAGLYVYTRTPTPALTLVKTALPATYAAPGDRVNYNYQVTNTGNVPLTAVTITHESFSGAGTLPRPTCFDSALAPGASTLCLSGYSFSQADIDAGAVRNSATANASSPFGPVTSAASTAVADAVRAESITISGDQATSPVTGPGEPIVFSFVVTNTGNTTLTGPSVVVESFTGTGTPPVITCPDTPLAPGATVTCTGTYTTTAADAAAGTVTLHVRATAQGPDGKTVTATVAVPSSSPRPPAARPVPPNASAHLAATGSAPLGPLMWSAAALLAVGVLGVRITARSRRGRDT